MAVEGGQAALHPLPLAIFEQKSTKHVRVQSHLKSLPCRFPRNVRAGAAENQIAEGHVKKRMEKPKKNPDCIACVKEYRWIPHKPGSTWSRKKKTF
jgi:hypothetical protein